MWYGTGVAAVMAGGDYACGRRRGKVEGRGKNGFDFTLRGCCNWSKDDRVEDEGGSIVSRWTQGREELGTESVLD